MAGRRSYGDILREARERRGFDIASMARRLHIRPDILKAIEEGDFERTPARGYTRNMVRSYANNLGLDASRITEMYLSEVHAFETGRPRSGAHYSNGYNSYIRHRETGRAPVSTRYDERARGGLHAFDDDPFDDLPRERSGRSGISSGRMARDARRREDADGYLVSDAAPRGTRRKPSVSGRRQSASSRTRQAGSVRGSNALQRGRASSAAEGARRQRPNRNARQEGASARALRSGGRNPSRSSRGSIGDVYVGQAPDKRNRAGYSSIYANGTGSSSSALMDKLPFLGIVAAVAIVVIVVLVLLFNGSKQSADNIPDIPISGLTDTSNPEGSINSNVTETAPTEAVFRYAVDDGAQSWIEIYENGSDTPSFAGVVNGPDEQEIKVTDKLVMLTANPGPVHIAVDGKTLEFKEDPDSAYYRCEVDFKEILENWKKEHPTIKISSSSSASTAART